MELYLIILISVVFVSGFAWMFIKGASESKYCEVCGDALVEFEAEQGKLCIECNAYVNGEVV